MEKIVKTIGHKAPVALRLADKLIEEKKGCASELEHLSEIFSTSDALLGLTSIGKKFNTKENEKLRFSNNTGCRSIEADEQTKTFSCF
ncbi:MAG: hypothetical protein IPJ93_15360 [Bacteroidota bacterium]|nr:MAG: hypothetical protein IPJ93_15360 [Bacteroidota bacterium]